METQSKQRIVGSVKAAEMIGVSRKTLDLWRSIGYGPKFYRPAQGNRSAAFYLVEDIEAFIESCRYQSTAEECEKKRLKFDPAKIGPRSGAFCGERLKPGVEPEWLNLNKIAEIEEPKI